MCVHVCSKEPFKTGLAIVETEGSENDTTGGFLSQTIEWFLNLLSQELQILDIKFIQHSFVRGMFAVGERIISTTTSCCSLCQTQRKMRAFDSLMAQLLMTGSC